jgi:pyruvate dehydrogenase E1 component
MVTGAGERFARAGSVDGVDRSTLDEIQRRVLWLAVRIVDAANRERATGDGLKVGGHQASSASLVTAMTVLWFVYLRASDRVSVKPHASPVLHAIQYLLGDLDRSYLLRFRARGGLQSYPSRTKDPDRVDFSTGSVGLGAVAPLFAGLVRQYVDAHFGARPRSRFVALLGDAELDEGNVWEAIAEPMTAGLGNVMWVVDCNRQSLDRVIPGVRIAQLRGQFSSAGWHCVDVKYGSRLRRLFAEPGGQDVREWIDAMTNEQYQSLFALPAADLRDGFLDGAPPAIHGVTRGVGDAELAALVRDLGGHDPVALLDAFQQCDRESERPSVVFAYTIKGWGLPIEGHPRNHAALLDGGQVDALRAATGLDRETEWDRFDAAAPAGILCDQRREALALAPRDPVLDIRVPSSTGYSSSRPVATQQAFGRMLMRLTRDEGVSPYLVTSAPDVTTSTNLGGFVNRVGVFSPTARRSWQADEVLQWVEGPTGQHIELGISEMNLFLLLGQLGLSWDLSDQPLLAVGTVYDPFVCRGLDALIYSVYSGARFVFAGTPSGVTLAPEGGAHQSTITPSIGLELPNLCSFEPAYCGALDWLLCDALGRIAAAVEDGSYYFRLTTRPLDQAPFERARKARGDGVLRTQVLGGAYRLVEANDLAEAGAPLVHLAGCGAVMPEVIAAAEELQGEGIAASVVDVTSPSRLYSAWQRTIRQGVRTATTPSTPGALRAAFPVPAPVVTVHDASAHTLAWLGSALGVPCVPLGVEEFGQSGSVADLYGLHDLLPSSIVNAALAALTLR